MLKMGWIISPYTVKQAAFDLQQKCGAFRSVQRASQIPIVLHCSLQRYSLFCVLTSILSHLMTSSVPNLHNTKILNTSGMRWDMTKRKTPFFFTFKGLSNSPIFQYLNFSFHRHFKGRRQNSSHASHDLPALELLNSQHSLEINSVCQRLLVELNCSQNSSSSILSKVLIARKLPASTTSFKGLNFHWSNDRKRARKSQPFFSPIYRLWTELNNETTTSLPCGIERGLKVWFSLTK